MSNLVPVGMSYHALADLLNNMASRIRSGDSFEGFIEYSMPDEMEESMSTAQVMVRGSYRFGNTQGQGGVHIIGTMPGI